MRSSHPVCAWRVSSCRYSFTGVVLNEMGGLKLTCTARQVTDNTCKAKGEYLVDEVSQWDP
jgi:hypothetical protein